MSAPACTPTTQQETGADDSRWPLERVLFALAGSVALLSALLAALISPWVLLYPRPQAHS